MDLFGGNDNSNDTRETDDGWRPIVVDGYQQWEYAVLDLEEAADGILASHRQQVSGGEGPSTSLLNEYGKEGWELVGTIEGAAKGVGGPSGGKTDYLLFKRPVYYERLDTDAEAKR